MPGQVFEVMLSTNRVGEDTQLFLKLEKRTVELAEVAYAYTRVDVLKAHPLNKDRVYVVKVIHYGDCN